MYDIFFKIRLFPTNSTYIIVVNYVLLDIVFFSQEIVGLSYKQAISPSFTSALLITLASTFEIAVNAISFGTYNVDSSDGIKLYYTLIVSSYKSPATLSAALAASVSSGSFASSLSYNAGLGKISVASITSSSKDTKGEDK